MSFSIVPSNLANNTGRVCRPGSATSSVWEAKAIAARQPRLVQGLTGDHGASWYQTYDYNDMIYTSIYPVPGTSLYLLVPPFPPTPSASLDAILPDPLLPSLQYLLIIVLLFPLAFLAPAIVPALKVISPLLHH